MFKQGDWVTDKESGRLGIVLNVFLDGVACKFGKATAIRRNEKISPADLDIQQEDIATMIDLALQTGDKAWFNELTERLGVEVNG